MSLRLALTINALLVLVFALMFVIIPEQSMAVYGATGLTDPTITMARWFGVSIIGYAALSWLARDLPDSDARRVIVLGLVVAWAVSTVMSLYVVLTGRVNALGWSSVAIDLALIALLGMHLRAKAASPPATPA